MEYWPLKYMGIPFKEKGRDDSGYDCWGLVCAVYKTEVGIILPSFDDQYEKISSKKVPRLFERHAKKWINVDVGSEKEFDVALLRLNGRPWHVAVVIGYGRMLHIMNGINVCSEKYRNALWSNRIVGFYRYKR